MRPQDLLDKLRLLDESEVCVALGQMVTDAACIDAKAINDLGPDRQVEWLLRRGISVEAIAKAAGVSVPMSRRDALDLLRSRFSSVPFDKEAQDALDALTGWITNGNAS